MQNILIFQVPQFCHALSATLDMAQNRSRGKLLDNVWHYTL